VGAAASVGGVFLGAWLNKKNILFTNRDNLVLKERAEVYVVLTARAAEYLRGVPVPGKLPTDAELEAKLNVYASKEVRARWADFRTTMEPLGAGESLNRMIDAAGRAPADSPVDKINQRIEAVDGSLLSQSKGRYELLLEAIKEELTPGRS
jgi:hypothetical protein